MNGKNPLDASAVPRGVSGGREIAARRTPLKSLIGIGRYQVTQTADFADETFGIPTVTDILAELEKPAATRARVQTASFRRAWGQSRT